MSDYFRHPNQQGQFPPVVQALLIANIAIFLLQGLGDQMALITRFALWPIVDDPLVDTAVGIRRIPEFQVWQLVTYAFLHGGLMHLFINMFVLWMFGTQMEQTWGSGRFLVYYFVCVVGAALVQLYVATQAAADGNIYPTVGASGGVFGVLLAFGMRYPNQYIMLLIPPIPMRAKYFVVLIGIVTLVLGMTGTQAGVAHFAHLGGMIAGLILILYWWGWLPIKPRRRMY